MKLKQLPFGVYDTDIKFVMGTYAEVSRYFSRKHDSEIPPDICGRYMAIGPENPRAYTHRFIIIITDRCTNKSERDRILIHEVVHCACDVFDNKGVIYSGENNEVLAYFVEWLYDECKGAMK